MFIKLALENFSPFMIVFYRMILAAVTLTAFVKWKKIPMLPYLKYWPHYLFMGFFANTLPFILITSGELWITSSLAAITNGSTPIFTALIAHFILHQERLTPSKTAGILFGFAGIIIVNIPALLAGSGSRLFGILCILFASISYAIGMIFLKKISPLKTPPYVFPAYQLIFSCLVNIPVGFLMNAYRLPSTVSFLSIFAIILLAVIATAIAFILYHQIIRREGATYLSYVTLLFPIVGMILGRVFLSEELTIYSYLGAGSIIFGLLLMHVRSKKVPL